MEDLNSYNWLKTLIWFVIVNQNTSDYFSYMIFIFEFALMYETLWLYNGPVKIQRSFNLRIIVFKLVLVMAILIHFAIYLTHVCDFPITTAKFANNCIEIHVQITIKLIVFICSYRHICMYLCWYLSNIHIYVTYIYIAFYRHDNRWYSSIIWGSTSNKRDKPRSVLYIHYKLIADNIEMSCLQESTNV